MEKTLQIHLSDQRKEITMTEQELRQKIAEQVRYELMPLCVCEQCGNLLEGRLIQQAINVILWGSKENPTLRV